MSSNFDKERQRQAQEEARERQLRTVREGFVGSEKNKSGNSRIKSDRIANGKRTHVCSRSVECKNSWNKDDSFANS
ncbi:hypothetical protein LX32DRAFT_692005 [Colletotrichum zoysiae]|uniref:Uncharacterized protein n=1 Tax=Colletotrichum zoysiae TaxID=1216348 RepID=A0AAD9HLD2_9PEZI|nr:hypothetical protein LX32DRAFT_692005 [Colletotrichum zoysiae]